MTVKVAGSFVIGRGRRYVVAVLVVLLGIGLSGSFPTGTLVIGDLSWDYLGGLVAGFGLALMWQAVR